MNRTVVGQVINTVDEGGYSIITVETPSGDIVLLRHDPSVSRAVPTMGGIYSIDYVVDGGTLVIQSIRKPKPGEYRASYRPTPNVEQPIIREHRPARLHSTASKSVVSLEDPIEESAAFFPDTYPRPEVRKKPTSEIKYRTPPRYHPPPGLDIISKARPDGISLITGIYLLIGVAALFLLPGLNVLMGGSFLLLGLGFYAYNKWAYWITLVLVALIAISIIGLIITIPAWTYLRRDEIRALYH